MRTLTALAMVLSFPAEAARPKSSLAYQYYTKGAELAANKKWEEALRQFQSAIDLNPAFVTSYVESARSSVMLGRRAEGLERLKAALGVTRRKDELERVQRERDNLSEVFYTNGTFQQYQNGLNYLRLERLGSAIDSFEKALKTEPDNLLLLVAYAKVLRSEDRAREAVGVLEKALALNDGRRELRFELAELLLPAQPEKALALLRELPAPALEERGVVLSAQALSTLKRNREALELLRAAFEQRPASVSLSFWLGKFYEKEPAGSWNARKYLMTFLRRSESALEGIPESRPEESRQLKALRSEAEQILSRVNQALE